MSSTLIPNVGEPDEILDPVARCITPDVARSILAIRLNPEIQRRVDDWAAKANEGQLTAEERAQYEDVVEKVDLLGILKSIARKSLAS